MSIAKAVEPPVERPTTISLADAAAHGFVVPARLTAGPRLSERYPALYPWAVRAHQARRHLQWLRSDASWASARAAEPLPVRVIKHSSLLMRELSEDEMVLQRNKVTNLGLATRRIDTVLIRPGETFSFNKVVGNCTRRKGYVEGMRLSNGEAISGVGGGICQLANLLHWMFLHSPLNDSDTTFQLRTWVDERHLRGELRADEATELSYRVHAREEVFLRYEGRIYRKNEIWRAAISKRTGKVVGEEHLKSNCALVKYAPPEERIVDIVD